MIYAFIRGYIGGFGRAILDFYLANSFVINALVLVYGLCVYLAHISYLSAYRLVLQKLGINLKTALKNKRKKKPYSSSKLDFQQVSWDEVRRSFWFPFIAPPKRLLITLKTNGELRKNFSADNVAQLLNSETTD